MKKSIYIFTILLMIAINSITAQIIQFQNPSFEGTPQSHVLPPGWSICLPHETPDTQPGSWGINLPPSNGNSYVGLVYQPSTGWQEGAGQTLNTPLIAGSKYSFFIDLAIPSTATPNMGILMPPACSKLQVWGGMATINSGCDQAQLLWTSPTILNTTWQTYVVKFRPTSNWNNILFIIYTPEPACSDGQYLLMDNISNVPSSIILDNPGFICSTSDSISALSGFNSYLWSTGETTRVINVTTSGTYYVTANLTGVNYMDSIQVTLSQPYLNLNLGNDTTICGNFNFVLNAGGGFSQYFWNNGSVDSSIIVHQSGVYNITTIDTGNCIYKDTIRVIIPSQSLNLGNDTAFCDNAPFTLDAGLYYDSYHWSTGDSTQTISISTSGTYYITATDNHCGSNSYDSITCVFGLLPADAGINDTICLNGSTTLHATGGNNYHWYPSTGLSCVNCADPIAAPLNTMTYTVQVTDIYGCSATDNVVVTVASAGVSVINTNCGLQNGSATVSFSGGLNHCSYTWNTTPAQYTPTATNLGPGSYSVSIYDSILNCTIIKYVTIVNIDNIGGPTITIGNIVNPNCNIANGTMTATISGGTQPITFIWNCSPPQTTATLTNVTQGTYCVTATDAKYCISTQCASLTLGPYPPPEICAATFDVSTQHCKLIWDKPLSAGINLYKIYRETISGGTYDLIGSQSFAVFSEFIDTSSIPAQQPYRYKMSLNDNCGFTSQLSNYHQTMYLVVADMGSTCNLQWNDYLGFTFSTYNIYRGPSFSNLTLINSVSSNDTSYIDVSPLSGMNYYMIEAVRPIVCNPSKSSTSPISNIPSIYMTGINEYAGGEHIQIYPNPNTGLFTVSILNPAFTSAEIEILNSLGQVVFSTQQNEATLNIDISNYASGVYIIKVNTERGNAIQKFIKE